MMVAGALLTGCAMPNSSNPTLRITGASVSADSARLTMELANPSDMDVRVRSAAWTLVYGPLPVAEGTWDLGVVVPHKGTHAFAQTVRFETPPLDPAAAEVELVGTLDLETVGNTGNTALSEAGFRAAAPVRR